MSVPGPRPTPDPAPDPGAGPDREGAPRPDPGNERPAGPRSPRDPGAGRRALGLAVLAAAAGAGLALWAAGHTWSVTVAARPAPLPPLRVTRTGSELVPWLAALGWVGLAGAGALLATRRLGRVLVAAVLVATGLGLLAGGGYGLAGLAGAQRVWPVLAACGGLLVGAAGVAAARRGRRWPAMGARYERAARRAGPVTDGDLWNALDRGEDPTAD